MKKVIIKNKLGVQTHGAEMPDPSIWISECVAGGFWGKPERSVPKSADYDEADVIEEYDEIISPEIPAVMNDAGEIVQEAIPAVTAKYVKLKAEYTIEIQDISAKIEQDKINAEALAYLAETDWMIIREMDANVPCPVDVKAKRAEARAKIVR
jgi:hypothetical protein